MAETITVPAGGPIPDPPAGQAWMRTRVVPRRSITLQAVTHPDNQPEPTPPPGYTWIMRHIGGQRVYAPTPQPFLHGYEEDT